MTEQSIGPLRQRMIEDMRVRGFTACTQRGYIAAVRNFTAFLGRSPDQADKEDLRRFQHHMRSSGASAANMNLAVSALRFFFGVTLGRGDADEMIAYAATFGFAAPQDRRGDQITVEGKVFRFSDVAFTDLASDPAVATPFASIPPATL